MWWTTVGGRTSMACAVVEAGILISTFSSLRKSKKTPDFLFEKKTKTYFISSPPFCLLFLPHHNGHQRGMYT
jgi:hypothetical protein